MTKPEDDANPDSEEHNIMVNKKNRLKDYLKSFQHFPETKPFIESYYLDKMTSMYAVNFRRALFISIIYKVVIEILNFVESAEFTFRTFVTVGKLFILFGYSFIANVRLIREQTNDVKIILLICIAIEIGLYITDIQYLNVNLKTQRTDNYSTE